MARTLGKKALARYLGGVTGRNEKSLSNRVGEWMHLPGFPVDCVPGRDPYFDAGEVLAWLDLNKPSWRQARGAERRELPAAPVAMAAQRAPQDDPAPLAGAEDAMVKVLLAASTGEDPRAVSRASMGLIARQIAGQATRGQITIATIDALKKSLEELRRSEDAWMEIAYRRGDLIEKDVAAAVAGQMAQRMRDCMDRFINGLATQFEMWNQDAAFCLPSNTAGRARAIRQWAEELARDVRQLEVDKIDQMIEEERQAGAA